MVGGINSECHFRKHQNTPNVPIHFHPANSGEIFTTNFGLLVPLKKTTPQPAPPQIPPTKNGNGEVRTPDLGTVLAALSDSELRPRIVVGGWGGEIIGNVR